MNLVQRTSLGLAFGALLVAPVSATLTKAAGRSGAIPVGGEGAPVALYTQVDNPSGNGVPDQEFEPSFSAYDSKAADDFIVTDVTGWTVEQVRTVGTTGTPGGSTVSVSFLTNSAGGGDPDLPGAAVPGCTYTGIAPTDTAGSFVINLPTACVLTQGTYWVEIQTAQNFGTFGQHFWSNRSTQTNSEAVWQNPGDGFASGCTSYTPQTTCGVGGGASPDLLFEIWGALGGAGTDVSILKTGVEPSAGTIVYTITVTNNGAGTANGVVVTDTLPAEVAFVSDDCGGSNTPPWTWNIGTLAGGASTTCHITTSVVTPGAILNTAGVTATNDSTPNNNSSSATVVGTPQVSIVEVPTLDTLGLALLLVALGGCAVAMIRRRAQA